MLKFIEVNHSILNKIKDRHENILKNIHNQSNNLSNSPQPKKMVPLKEYSNKFLRENQFNIKQKQNQKISKNNRLNNLVTKHKFFQKKFTGKNAYVCKTQPNENQYKCFMTSNNFYKQRQNIGTHTEQVSGNNHNLFFEFENEDWRHSQAEVDLRAIKNRIESKIKSKAEVGTIKMEEKISASRALQMYAKIISKDRSQLVEKIKFSNPKKTIKEKILQSRKNLQICQMNLVEKQKKMSVIVEKSQKCQKNSSKNILKYRKKTKSVDFKAILKEEDNFELKGWES